ncbi:hypothetical protein AAZX31_10G224400 [Glycine max]
MSRQRTTVSAGLGPPAVTGFTKCVGELHVLNGVMSTNMGFGCVYSPSFNDSGTIKPTLSISMDQSSSLNAFVNDNKIPNPATEKTQNGKRKYKKKEYNLPRRASKRLAGIKVDPAIELKTSRFKRVAINQSCESKMITNMDEHPSCLPVGIVNQQFDAVEGGTESKSKFDCTFEEYMRLLENGEKVDGMSDYSRDFPIAEILKDPCIAFAVQVLTGDTFETYYKKSQMPSESLAAVEGQNIIDVEQEECKTVLSPPEKLIIPKECVAADEIGHTDQGNENLGTSSEMPLEISRMDSLLEYAKSLFDSGNAIPLDTDSKELPSATTQLIKCSSKL